MDDAVDADADVDEIMDLNARILELEMELDRSRVRERSLRSMNSELQAALIIESSSSSSPEEGTSSTMAIPQHVNRDPREVPVLEAASRGDSVALELLLTNRGEGISAARNRQTRDDALIVAAEYGHLETVKYLIESAGADVHAGHDSAFLWACRNGSLALVDYLISRGANVHVLGRCGLALAIAGGHHEVVDVVLRRSSLVRK